MEISATALFPTVIWSTRFADHESLNRQLQQSINALHDSDPAGVQHTNINGWQSPNTIQTLEQFHEINGRIMAICRQVGISAGFARDAEYRYQAWVNINPPGAFNQVHVHPNCHLSGVYYVTAPADSGSIYFRDPRLRSSMAPAPLDRTTEFTASEMALPAEAGRLYVFPAWLEHGVQPNNSDTDRVGISFNVQVTPLPGSGL